MRIFWLIFIAQGSLLLQAQAPGALTPRDLFLDQRSKHQKTGGSAIADRNARLTVRYRIQKELKTGEFLGVDSEREAFRSGDRVRVVVQTSMPAHIVILQRGSSGRVSVLFPAEEEGSRLLPPSQQASLPEESAFTFDSRPGEERLYLVVSRHALTHKSALLLLGDTPVDAVSTRSRSGETVAAAVQREQEHVEKLGNEVVFYAAASDAGDTLVCPLTLLHR